MYFDMLDSSLHFSDPMKLSVLIVQCFVGIVAIQCLNESLLFLRSLLLTLLYESCQYVSRQVQLIILDGEGDSLFLLVSGRSHHLENSVLVNRKTDIGFSSQRNIFETRLGNLMAILDRLTLLTLENSNFHISSSSIKITFGVRAWECCVFCNDFGHSYFVIISHDCNSN